MATVKKIVRQAFNRLSLLEISGEMVREADDEALRIITEAVEAGVRVGIMLAFQHPAHAARTMIGD